MDVRLENYDGNWVKIDEDGENAMIEILYLKYLLDR